MKHLSMLGRVFVLSFNTILLCAAQPLSATEVLDDFDNVRSSFAQWDDRQADRSSLMFMKEPKGERIYLLNRIDGAQEHNDPGPVCPNDEPLAPSCIVPSAASDAGPKCPIAERRNGKVIHQRNELRLRNPQVNFHPADASHWYSISFKLAGTEGEEIPSCGSVRWVIAQWKYTEMDCNANASPFLAQRFDNGILHVTVEDGVCRCMIASAPGDPYVKTASRISPFVQLPLPGRLQRVAPLKCLTHDERPCKPNRLELFATNPEAMKTLPDPKADWVRMTYFVRADGPSGSQFDVYANDNFIVRAVGARPEGIRFPNRVKFKFGHYRDKIQSRADLMVDRVCISRNPKRCGIMPPP
ncbi:MAG TPA: heparin lyase I family protein [Aestuariivirgaceae bacterium]|jgi:hypothetical protein